MASSSKKSAAKANLLGKRKPEDDLEIKPIMRKHKEKSEEKETKKEYAHFLQQIKRRIQLLETKSDQANLISVKEVTIRKKTIFVLYLPARIKISDIIDFFKDVGEVVRVQLIINEKGQRMNCGFVEFASADEAKKALQKKNGEYLQTRKIFVVDVAEITPYHSQPKYCMDHKVWYKDYLPIEEDETHTNFAEKVLFVDNLSPQTKLLHVIKFKYYGGVVNVRFIVNHEGKHVGYGFVEFVSSHEAEKALEKKNYEYLHDCKIVFDLQGSSISSRTGGIA